MLPPLARTLALAAALLLGMAAAPAGAEELASDQRQELDHQLEKLRSSSDPLLQLTPLEHIGEIGPAAVQAAMADIFPLLDSSEADVRRTVLRLLVPPVLLDAGQLSRIERMQADTDDQVRGLVRDLLAAANQAREQSRSQDALRAVRAMDDAHLIAELASADLERREHACTVAEERLGGESHRQAFASHGKALGELARNPDSAVRRLALLMLARCLTVLDASQVAAALDDLQDDHAEVIAAALEALARAGASDHARVAAAVRPFAQDASVGERPRALATLSTIGAWGQAESDQALEALSGDPASLSLVFEAITASGTHDKALGKGLALGCGESRLPAATRCLEMKALVATADPTLAVATLETLVGSHSEPTAVRQGACTALMLVADQATLALTVLQGVGDDTHEDPELRKAAQAAAAMIARH